MKEYEIYLKHKDKELTESDSDNIKSFIQELKQSGKSGSTLNRKMVSLRKYYEYLRMNAYIAVNPCLKVKVPKIEFKAPEYLSIEQITKLLDSPDDSDLGKRDKAMLELLYACGLKASELASLNIEDLDLRMGFV